MGNPVLLAVTSIGSMVGRHETGSNLFEGGKRTITLWQIVHSILQVPLEAVVSAAIGGFPMHGLVNL